jgi:hypothetical protein
MSISKMKQTSLQQHSGEGQISLEPALNQGQTSLQQHSGEGQISLEPALNQGQTSMERHVRKK